MTDFNAQEYWAGREFAKWVVHLSERRRKGRSDRKCLAKRALAIQAGAVEVERAEMGRILRRIRQSGRF